MLRGNFALAYHGCDEEVGEKILRNSEHVSVSENEYDWLGEGAYFWENSPARALNWAEFVKDHPQHFKHRIKKPFIIGAIVDLGNCLDLTDIQSLKLISNSYDLFKGVHDVMETKMPVNEPSYGGDEDLVKRHLDCAVINFVHFVRETNKHPAFDTVRGVFTEGRELYPGAKIMSKTHVQICVRNPSVSVRAYFRPMRDER